MIDIQTRRGPEMKLRRLTPGRTYMRACLEALYELTAVGTKEFTTEDEMHEVEKYMPDGYYGRDHFHSTMHQYAIPGRIVKHVFGHSEYRFTKHARNILKALLE